VPTLDIDDLDAVLQVVHSYARRSINARANDASGTLSPELLNGLADLGCMALVFPESAGGLGLGLQAACQVIACLAQHDRSVATTLGVHLGLGSRGLVAFGSDELKARLLPKLASGRRIGAFAATEPGAGSDLTALSTRAVLHPDRIVIDGSKVYVTNGAIAGVYSVVTYLFTPDGEALGKAIIAVLPEDDGVVIGPEEHKLGLRASSTTSLHLDQVTVPRWRLLGAPGDGEKQLAHILSWGRTVMAAGCVGSAKRALELARQQCATRWQFGGTLDQQPVVQAQLSEAAATVFAMDCLVEHAAASQGADLLRGSTAAKVFCSEGAFEVSDVTLQLHGGMGYIEETDVPLLVRDARITRIFEGANDVLLGHLGALSLRVRATSTAHLERRAIAFIDETVASIGIRILRRPRELHRIGRIAVLAEAALAVAARGQGHVLAEHFNALAANRLEAVAVRPVPLPNLSEVD
jgi:alkylation response protein AidB-like acyl-CoA dehydrogenase